MFSPPDSSDSLSHFIDTTFSYGGNVMLAAIISLLVVILFVLLLHLYAKWFLAQARHRRRTSTSVSHILGPTRFHTFTFDTTLSDSPTKGLDSSIIASIPVFVYENNGGGGRGGGEGGGLDLECVVCLSVFEEGEAGRNLPKCGHGFHVECIDMWLRSHTNCPICRAPVAVVCEDLNKGEESGGQMGVIVEEDSTIEIVIEQGVASVDNVVIYDSSPAASSSSLGCSLKRMLSRNKLENKIYPFSTCNELDA